MRASEMFVLINFCRCYANNGYTASFVSVKKKKKKGLQRNKPSSSYKEITVRITYLLYEILWDLCSMEKWSGHNQEPMSPCGQY